MCLHLAKNGQHGLEESSFIGDGNKRCWFTILTAAAGSLNRAAGFQIVKFSMRTDFHGTLSLPTEKHYVYLQPSVFS